jgi:NADH:ubiquinone oxidoreductase subunit E
MRATLIAAGLLLACIAALSVDYGIARVRDAKDEKSIEALQQKVRADSTIAPKLEAAKNELGARKRTRKTRISYFSAVLMLAAACFLTLAKAQLARRGRTAPPPEPPKREDIKSNGRPPALAKACVCEIDLTVVDGIIAREGKTAEAAIPILQAIQAHYRYLPDEALRRVCETTSITPAQLSGTSSFYSRFRNAPVGEHIVRVCHGTACHVSGARQITDELRRGLNIPEGSDTDPSRTFTVEEVACLGCCSLAPVMMVDERTVGKLRPADACDALGATEKQA